MMRILLGHNYYQVHGGEDRVFLNEKSLLQRNGHEVIEYVRHNSDIERSGLLGYATLPARTMWNWDTYAEVKRLIRKHEPDIAHFHNIFPLISPAVYSACWECTVPVVQSLHNARLICPAGGLYCHGQYCQDCVGKRIPWSGIARACYRNSRIQTGLVGAMTGMHRLLGTWATKISRYVVFSQFYQRRFVEAGFPAEKLAIKPHFTDDHGLRANRGLYALYVGRLTEQKGFRTLLSAWKQLGHIPLKICGDGDLAPSARELARRSGGAVEMLSFVAHSKVIGLMKEAAFLVWPSELSETFGLVALEAFACGVPVVSSGLGAMPELVTNNKTGLDFRAGDADDLARRVGWAWEHTLEMAEMGLAARLKYEAHYTAERNHDRLMQIYREAIEQRRMDSI